MKKILALFLMTVMTFCLFSCVKEEPKKEEEPKTKTFLATVISVTDDAVLVEPQAGEEECNSSDRIVFHYNGADFCGKAGDVIEILYDGVIAETYPAQITIIDYEIYQAKSEPTTTTTVPATTKTEPTTTTTVPTTTKTEPTTTKPKTTTTKQKTTTTKPKTTTTKPPTTTEPPWLDAKPVIYLYPQQPIDVFVQLKLNGKLTCTYPQYQNGWQVKAFPDGTLLDAKGQTYNYLYWEGEAFHQWDMQTGFCVKGEDTAAFLENALAKLGLTRQEANEFIVYWLPLMQDNPYNLIAFQTKAYQDAAKLEITPAPDTLIRVFMTYKALDFPMEIQPQTLTAPQREGFVAVEWGGTIIQ